MEFVPGALDPIEVSQTVSQVICQEKQKQNTDACQGKQQQNTDIFQENRQRNTDINKTLDVIASTVSKLSGVGLIHIFGLSRFYLFLTSQRYSMVMIGKTVLTNGSTLKENVFMPVNYDGCGRRDVLPAF